MTCWRSSRGRLRNEVRGFVFGFVMFANNVLVRLIEALRQELCAFNSLSSLLLGLVELEILGF